MAIPVNALKPAIGFGAVRSAIFQVKTERQGLGIRMDGSDGIMIRQAVFEIDDQRIIIFPDVFAFTWPSSMRSVWCRK